MPKKFWQFRNQTADSAELLLYGDISDSSWWGDEVTPKTFADELNALGPLTSLTVRINSGGGDVFAAQTMDLAKKTYSTTPDYFIAGTTVGIVTAAKEASAAIAAHNLVLLDGGKVKPLAAVDGSNALNVTGLYGIAAEDAASGEDAVIYLTGEFFAEGLALPDGVTAADIEVALRNIGIFLK